MGSAGIKAAAIELHNGRGKSPDIMLTRGHDVTDVSVSALSPVSGPALTLARPGRLCPETQIAVKQLKIC